MKVKIAAGTIVFFLTSVLGLMAYAISDMDSETIIICAKRGGGYIPSKLCEYYIFNHRNIKDDVKTLESDTGLAFILNGEDTGNKYKIAEYYLINGIDINGVNHNGEANLTPLHSAVVYNNIKVINFLLKHGADTNIKPPSINLTPLGFAQFMQKRYPSVDRSGIIQALKIRQK